MLETSYTRPGTADYPVDIHPTAAYAIHVGVLRMRRITRGCDVDPLRYCPDDPTTEGRMASFLVRALVPMFGGYHADALQILATVYGLQGVSRVVR